MQSEEPTIIQSLENHLAEYGHTTVGQDIAAAILVIKDLHQKATLSAQVQDVAGEHVAWRLRHKNDGPHMWEYYQLPEAEASDNVVIQKLTIKQLIDILNDDKHAGAQERPPEPHSPNASVPIDLLQKIWAEMYYGVGGEGGIDDSIAQWNLNEVVDILAMAGALPDVDEPTALAKQEENRNEAN